MSIIPEPYAPAVEVCGEADINHATEVRVMNAAERRAWWRWYFAGQIAAGMEANPAWYAERPTGDDTAVAAVSVADALVKRLVERLEE